MLWVDAHRPKTFSTLDVNCDVTKKLELIAKSGDFPHLLVYGPPGAGKKTRVMALLREHYGMGAGKVKMEQRMLKVRESKEIEVGVLVSNHHIEINPSESGMYDREVVMLLLKEIAMSVPLTDTAGKRSFKVVVLNEVEKLSKGAQQALRRTMELYMATCRLVLITTSMSRLIPPLRSRCLAVRVPLPAPEELKSVLINTAKKENAKLSEGLAVRILKECNGNMRRALLVLEATKIQKNSLEDHIEPVLPDWSLFLAEIARDIIEEQTPKRIWEVRAKIYELLGNCVPPEVIIQGLALNLIKKVDSSTQAKIAAIAAHFEHNLRMGSKPIVHIEAFVCEVMTQRIPAARWTTGDRMYGMTALPGGRLFVGGAGSGEVKVYDPRNGKLETQLEPMSSEVEGVGHSDAVLAVTYNSLGIFTSGADLSIMQWDHNTYECIKSYMGHKGLVAALCVMPSDYGTGLFSGSDDRTIKQWNTNTSKCVFTFKGHKSAVNCITTSDRWLFSGSKSIIKVWSISARKCIRQIDAHTDAVWSLRITGEGQLISGSSDSTIKVWDDPAGRAECERVLMGHQGQVRSLLVHGLILFSCSKDGTVACWDMETWKVKEVLFGHEKTVTCMTLQNNQLCTCSFDKHVNRWDVTDLLTVKQPITQFIPYDNERVEKERKKKKDDAYHTHDEKKYYNKEKKRALIKMDPREAVFHYDALPINFVIDKLDYKVKSSKLFLDSIVFIPFLLMFVFFFLVSREIEQSYFITRAATDVMEGNEIARQPWCRLPDGSPWDNRDTGAPYIPVQCDPKVGILKVAKRFGDIANAGDFNDWAMGVLLPGLFQGAGGADGNAERRPPTTGGKYLIGAVRFRTMRVKNDTCSVNSEFFSGSLYEPENEALLEFYQQCYGPWSPSKTSMEPFACEESSTCNRYPYPTGSFNKVGYLEQQLGVTKQWADKWFDDLGFKYFTSGEIGGTGTAGQVGDRLWPPGGHTVEIPFYSSPNAARDMMAAIIDNGFVDNRATRFVTVEYMTYTPFVNYFTAHKYFVEVAPGGAWLSEGVTKNFRVWTTNMTSKTIYDFFFFSFILFYCVAFVREWYSDYLTSKSILKFIFDAWNFLELVNLVCFLVIFVYRFIWWGLSVTNSEKAKMPPVSTEYPKDLDYILDAFMMQVWTNSVNTILTFLKILKFVRLNDRLNILTRTLAACQQSILGVLVLFVWVVFGYAITGNSVFGGGIFEFRSINSSFSTLLRYLLGDFDYPALRDENKQMASAFFWTFQVLGLFLLLNFLIAVISDAFADVSAEQSFIDLDSTLAKTFEDVKSECLPASLQRKWKLIKHRKTQTGLLSQVRNAMKEFRNKMLSDEDVEAQEHRQQLASIFVHRDDYMSTIPVHIKDDLSEEFLYRVWLDIAWEYNKDQRDEYHQSAERARELIQEKAAEQILRLKDEMGVVQDIRGRFDDLESRIRPLVQSWKVKK